MIRSMTGYGAAERSTERVRVAVEVRSVNNRYLKVNLRCPEGLGGVEVRLEALLRRRIARGTVTVTLAVEPQGPAARAPIRTDILEAYRRDLAGVAPDVSADALLALPGVVGDPAAEGGGLGGLAEVPDLAEAALGEALDHLDRMREAEGRATAADMAQALECIETGIAQVAERAPAVVEAYRARLQERLQSLLDGMAVGLDDASLAREVALLAERADVSEELARLGSHVRQFRALLEAEEPAGRRLEFLAQEMYREVNTIGAKANDAEVGRLAVDLKVAVDRLREQAQNVE